VSAFRTRFSSERQEWHTPAGLFWPLEDEFHFTLDAAASIDNAVATDFFTETDDGLAQDWGSHVVWLNPPYGAAASRLSDWVRKAHQASLGGATVVMLIPARTNTSWFHDYCLRHGEVRFIRGRPKFGDAIHGLPQPLCIVVFRPVAKSNVLRLVA
jgi:phage N-6-adenine-methyltransferase